MDIINNAVTFENYRDSASYKLAVATGEELDRLALLNGWHLRSHQQTDETYRRELFSLMKAKNAMANAGGNTGSIAIYVGNDENPDFEYYHAYYLCGLEGGEYGHAFTGINQMDAKHWKCVKVDMLKHYLDESGPFLVDPPEEVKPTDGIKAHAEIVDHPSWEITCRKHIKMKNSSGLDNLAKVNEWRERLPGQDDDSFRRELYSLAKAANARYRSTARKDARGLARFDGGLVMGNLNLALVIGHCYMATDGGYIRNQKCMRLFVGDDENNPDSWVTVRESECTRIYRQFAPFLILSGTITRPADEMSILPGKIASFEDAAHTITLDDMPPSPGQIDNMRFNHSEETEPDTLADLVGQYAVLHGRYVAAQEELNSTTKALRDKKSAAYDAMNDCGNKIAKLLEPHGITARIEPKA